LSNRSTAPNRKPPSPDGGFSAFADLPNDVPFYPINVSQQAGIASSANRELRTMSILRTSPPLRPLLCFPSA